MIAAWLPELARSLAPEVRSIEPAAVELLLKEPWPGNARELRNVLSQALLTAPSGTVRVTDVLRVLKSLPAGGPRPLIEIEDRERADLLNALEANYWRLGRTASALGMSRSTLWRRMTKHAIKRG